MKVKTILTLIVFILGIMVGSHLRNIYWEKEVRGYAHTGLMLVDDRMYQILPAREACK